MTSKWRRLLAPFLATLVMLAVLVALGTWQVDRLRWKEAILAQIATAEAGPAQPITADPSPFQKVSVTGRFRYDLATWYGDDVRLLPSGPQMGFFQIVPLERSNGTPILVDRGWVPDGLDVPVNNPNDSVTVEGYIMPPAGHSWFGVGDDPAGRHFYVLDAATIGKALHLPDAEPYVLVAMGADRPGDYPAPATHLPRPLNNHLSYAITWYGLAASLIVIFITWARKAVRD